MKTPNPRGFATENPIHRLRYAIPERRSHWSFNERLRTRPKAPKVIRTPEQVKQDALRLAMRLLRAM